MSAYPKMIRNLLLAGAASFTLSLTMTATSVAAPEAVPAAPEAPTALWSAASLADLRAEVSASANEGLEPATYGIEALDGRNPGAETDAIATAIETALAVHYVRGSIDDPSRLDWHIDRPAGDLNTLRAQVEAAARQGRLQPFLRSLLPTDPRYAALRDAYAVTPASDDAMRDRLRANLERWKWMPRSLGADHIYVNVPSYSLSVIDDGQTVSSYTVVVGAPKTPTPQIAMEATSVVVNPWWTVPTSIARTMRASAGKGYVREGGRIRQRPGPGNALGKVKIDMPNPHAIYLHDTPSKALFAKDSRAFSHGCIRVKDIDRLAVELVELDQGKIDTVERALAGSTTQTVPLATQRAVYLVYFTAEGRPGGAVTSYEDPYGRDAKLIASLDTMAKLALAKRPGSAARA